MMKLRLRSLDSNQTLKLQFPNSPPCTIAQLKQTLISQIENPHSIHLSLNKIDRIDAEDDAVTLQSVGITSGDLLYYSVDASAFKTPNLGQIESPNLDSETLDVGSSQISGKIEIFDSDLKTLEIGSSRGGEFGGKVENTNLDSKTLDVGSSQADECGGKFEEHNLESESVEIGSSQGGDISRKVENLDSDSKTVEFGGDRKIGDLGFGSGDREIVGGSSGSNKERVFEALRGFGYGGGEDTDESEGSDMSDTDSEIEEEEREVEGMDVDIVGDTGVVTGKKFSEQGFLRRVLREELGGDVGNHRLVVIAIHAAFLEAGFVGIDSVSGMRVDRFFLADQWPSMAFGMSLWYTLPEVLGEGKAVESVSLRFQSLGQFVNVYGVVVGAGSATYRVCLDEGRFRPALDAMWGYWDLSVATRQNYENEVFEFWKIVKDGLALPLMIDLCEKAGLVAPPCFMRLPTELKFKILEFVPGVDIGKVACVCSELKFLSCNSDLWKKKYGEEFGVGSDLDESSNWKKEFISTWRIFERRKRQFVPWEPRPNRRVIRFPQIRDGDQLLAGGMGAGDFDLPFFGIPLPIGRRGPVGGAFLRHPARRNFAPPCNLGGFNA